MSGLTPWDIARAQQHLKAHPFEPEGNVCPGCQRVGLTHLIPCGTAMPDILRILRAEGLLPVPH
jgi:hypothetical protein